MKNKVTFSPFNPPDLPDIQGEVMWRSPSNIAIVKYWGKYGVQLPQNPSLSFTLSNSYTETSIHYQTLKNTTSDAIPVLEFYFEGKENPTFATKIEKYLQRILADFPFLKNLRLRINSSNSFPHSAGIASSASGMSALVLGICSIEQELKQNAGQEKLKQADFLRKASYFSRLASGSASRSVYPEAAVWGTSETVLGSSNDYAVPFSDCLPPIFKNFRDDILIVSKSEKSVSSRAGHALMNANPYAETRYAHARKNLTNLVEIIRLGDLEGFIKITENEALTLHALMMMSDPSFILLQPNTLALIEKIRVFRVETHLPICFTIDAGPNIHLLYPAQVSEKVQDFIQSELLSLCTNQYRIVDQMGQGAKQLI